MPTTLTLKNIPDEVYERLKMSAHAHRRSLNSEALVCLESVLLLKHVTVGDRLARACAARCIAERKISSKGYQRLQTRRSAVIVVDSNIVAYLYLPGDYTAKAEALLQRDADWAAPMLWRSEFRNILAGYMRRKVLTFETARDLQLEAENLLAGAEHEVDSRLVLELVRDSDCSACDCEFIALAMVLGVKLVTMDAKLLKAFPRCATDLSAA
jgi:predicted nucleic acid-binding protein/plasmid stability protein